MNRCALIIFVKNPIAGKVKTRLARDIGNTKAVEVYGKLLQHTHDIVAKIDVDRYVFYGDYVNADDLWNDGFYKELQEQEADLGGRMLSAFQKLFDKGHKKVLIVGSDCVELNTAILQDAFTSLSERDIVVGPTYDGGYYLLGMTKLYSQLFENIEWSTERVYSKTIEIINVIGDSYTTLDMLNDVDYVKDVPKEWL